MNARPCFSGGSFFDFQGPFRSTKDIILASSSPRRQALLSSLGICFQVVPARFREPDPEPGQKPEEYALYMAKQKAMEVAGKKPDALVIAADTIVVLDQIILGKPLSDAQAFEMLRKLQGKTHRVITAVNIRSIKQKIEKIIVCGTFVEMSPVNDEILLQYVKTKEPEDKAGAYAIQGLGAFLIKSVHGSYTNVVGLPLAEVWNALFEIKAIGMPGEKTP
jgi:septum formation protein